MSQELQQCQIHKRKSFFLEKLFKILDNPQTQHILKWHQDGFIIQNIELLEKEILQESFKHSHYASFARQLNIYGFTQKERQVNFIYYIHESISSSKRDLIQEKQLKKKQQKKIVEDSTLFQIQIEIENELSQLKIHQQQLQKSIQLHVNIMKLLNNYIKQLFFKIQQFIEQFQYNHLHVARNGTTLYSHAQNYLIIFQQKILRMTHPELFKFDSPSFPSTPIPFPFYIRDQ